SLPTGTSSSPGSAGWNVSAPKSRLPCSTSTAICRAGTRRTSIVMSGYCWRKRATSGNSVWTAASFEPTRTRPRRRSRSSRTACSRSSRGRPEPLTVVLQHAPRFGERAGLRRPVEQLLAEFDLEAAHRLADRGLGAVHLGRRARKAALVGDREEDLQRRQV